MASSNANFCAGDDFRKARELEEARKAGLAPAERDEDGKEINPHIPQYMAAAPWYLNTTGPVRGPFPLQGILCVVVLRCQSIAAHGYATTRTTCVCSAGPALRPLESMAWMASS